MSSGRSAIPVAEAKRRFSELIDRVQKGERIVVSRRGKPVVTLSSPGQAAGPQRPAPTGLAAAAGALADWEELDQDVRDIYAARRRSRERAVPPLDE